MVLYTFTVKYVTKNMKQCKPSDYVQDVFKLWRFYEIIPRNVIYERDRTGRCHAHGIVNIPNNFYIKKLTDIKGVHTRLDVCYDLENWMSYIKKDLCPLNEICKHDDECVMQRIRKPLFNRI